MIPFEDIDERLKGIDKNRQWLAETLGRSPDSIRTSLAPNAPAAKRSKLLQRSITEAIEKEEALQREAQKTIDSTPPGYSAIFLDDKELDIADRASRLAGAPSLAVFCHDVIQAEARRVISLHEEQPVNNIFWLDLRGGVAAGSQIDTHISAEPIPVPREYPADHYALRVFGNSMEPKIADGSLIIVKRWGTDKGFPKKGTIVVYSDGQGSTLKEFGYEKGIEGQEADAFGNVPVLRSINKASKDIQTMDGGRIDAVFVEAL